MPLGKPAGVPCVQLDEALRCRLFGRPERPAVCTSLRPAAEMCGHSREQALHWLAGLERLTALEPARSVTVIKDDRAAPAQTAGAVADARQPTHPRSTA